MIAEIFRMKKLKAIALAGLTLASASTLAVAAGGQKDAKHIAFSFDGAFGTFDRGQLQRGFKVYKEVCSNCHSLNLISFRNLSEGGIFTEEQVKALAATYTVKDGPNADGDMFERPGLPSDRIPAIYANEQASRVANNGAYPPDMSLLTKARPGWYGTFNQLWNGIGGPQYVYSVLTGYQDAPAELGETAPDGKYYNPYFGSGHWIGMGAPLVDGIVTYDDGAPNTTDDMARDISAFLAFTADPNMETRKSTGFMVMIYLFVLSMLLYFVKKKVWADLH
jgi:ubiquinol-cytochrome c reductase cytochrome c1 subunit